MCLVWYHEGCHEHGALWRYFIDKSEKNIDVLGRSIISKSSWLAQVRFNEVQLPRLMVGLVPRGEGTGLVPQRIGSPA